MSEEIKLFPPKDPHEELDYTVSWDDWLDDDTIATAVATVPTGITLESQSNTTTTHTVWLSGGTAGQTYPIVSNITTAAGREGYRTVYLDVENK